jgi:hypothetical protein
MFSELPRWPRGFARNSDVDSDSGGENGPEKLW